MRTRAKTCAWIAATALFLGGAGVSGCGEDESQPEPQPLEPATSTPEELERAERKAQRAEERLEESLSEAKENVEGGSGDLNY